MSDQKIVEKILFPSVRLNEQQFTEHLHRKTVVITGASSGIGEQFAYKCSQANCKLILVARRGEKLSELKQSIESIGHATVHTYEADLRYEEGMEGFLAFLHKQPSGLDIVVSNAGLSIRRSIYDSIDRYHDFTRTMAINYFAPVQLFLNVIPLLKKSQGQIVNISTVNALLAPVPYFAAYQGSKTALDVWLRSTAPELQADGITVTTMYFPLVKTPMIAPTKEYEKVPAMSSNHAAKLIAKHLYTKKKRYKPWWLVFGQLASVFLTGLKDMSKKKASRK